MRRQKRGCFSYIVVIFLSFVAAFILAGHLEDDPVDLSGLNGTDDDNNNNINITYTDASLYYEQLNSDEKKVYDAFIKSVEDGSYSVTLKNVELDKYDRDLGMKIVKAVTYDHPEYFWLQCGYSRSESRPLFSETGDLYFSLMKYDFWEVASDKDRRIAALDNAVKSVAAQAAAKPGDFERIQFVHDYLIENAYYDFDSLSESESSVHDSSCEYIYTAYGCLVNGRTVCAGYAKAFQLIMRELGYDCMYVTGDAGGPHAWNCIILDGEGYYMDVTWDDRDFGTHDEPVYDYCGITTESLGKTHELDDTFDYPLCSGEKYNYFVYNGYRMDKYDYDGLCDIMADQAGQYVYNVQFSSSGELKKAYDDLSGWDIVHGSKCRAIPVFAGANAVEWCINEDHYTLTFILK